jgi:hypothetical protein
VAKLLPGHKERRHAAGRVFVLCIPRPTVTLMDRESFSFGQLQARENA